MTICWQVPYGSGSTAVLVVLRYHGIPWPLQWKRNTAVPRKYRGTAQH